MTRILIAVNIVMALTATAVAEPPPVFYEGSRCFRIDAKGKQAGFHTIVVPSLVVPVTEAAEATRAHDSLLACSARLAACERVKEQPSQFWSAVRWGGYGAGLALAFIAGAVLL